ncbi:Hsp20/alpha crystallin family protein [Desulfobacula phenolica]|uniref:Molecular chaperone IbpA, HSP20 family n=1 Tax=Desulfobacula phenolica TaxID=90732 RepID=A0A1H2GMH1_9BACT|nr:Hsp20/alpha crystallin family protein [Desulfobacula phenolica]SDU20755.1 Molecular chaperone IbpA, HSP20 family [Desulfobacula phenolica]
MSDRKDIAKKQAKDIEKTRELRTEIPYVDIYENDDEILLHADMPGVNKNDVSVNIDNGTLYLSGLRRCDNKGISTREEFSDVEYVRNFSVPPSIDVERVKAELKDGVLKLHMPKSEAAKPKMIEIKAA